MGDSLEGSGKKLVGAVVSNSSQKTIIVKVETKVRHPLYGKYIRRSKKYHAHDENEQCQKGDVVQIKETLPISKRKSWKLVEVLSKNDDIAVSS